MAFTRISSFSRSFPPPVSPQSFDERRASETKNPQCLPWVGDWSQGQALPQQSPPMPTLSLNSRVSVCTRNRHHANLVGPAWSADPPAKTRVSPHVCLGTRVSAQTIFSEDGTPVELPSRWNLVCGSTSRVLTLQRTLQVFSPSFPPKVRSPLWVDSTVIGLASFCRLVIAGQSACFLCTSLHQNPQVIVVRQCNL